MKLLFLSDTHGNLPYLIHQINIIGIDLIVLLGDNTIEDLNILRNINIPKIGVIGNHRFRGNDGNIGKLEEFGIEDISFKLFEFSGIRFIGIDGNISYQLAEDMEEKGAMKIFNPKIQDELLKFKSLKQELLKTKKYRFSYFSFPS